MSKIAAICVVFLVLGVFAYYDFKESGEMVEVVEVNEPILVGHYSFVYLGDYKLSITQVSNRRNSQVHELLSWGSNQFDLGTHIVIVRALSGSTISLRITEN